MFFCSVRTRGNFSPARNVRSTTEPELSDFSFVRTNAPPFPGLTCWNSTMRQGSPSSSMCMPFRNWFVETCSATAGQSSAPKRTPSQRTDHSDEQQRRQARDVATQEGIAATHRLQRASKHAEVRLALRELRPDRRK